ADQQFIGKYCRRIRHLSQGAKSLIPLSHSPRAPPWALRRRRAIVLLPRDPAGLPPHTACPHALDPSPLPRCSPLTTRTLASSPSWNAAGRSRGDRIQPAVEGCCPVLEECAGRGETLPRGAAARGVQPR
uniref:Uncharacterized protein n=6 Tax=Aegilops tauschii subsp. strangulata TaxID=200361 RepID=A0A453ESW8_AEGTS